MERFLLLACFSISIAVAGCGGSGAQDVSGRPEASSTHAAQQSVPVEEVTGAPTPRRPRIPPGPPPKKVVIKDLKKGPGIRIQPRDGFTANFVALEYETGKEVETFWGESAFKWFWRRNQLTKGWEIGLEGMRVGGQRELIVPSKLAYDSGARVYFVELLKVDP